MSDCRPNSLTIFYDAQCPLCSLEMDKLKSYDDHQLIKLIDLNRPEQVSGYPQINIDKAMDKLHGIYGKTTMLYELDVTYMAWTLVGKKHYVWPLKVPILKQVLRMFYLVFANNRHPISKFCFKYLKIGKIQCNQGVCHDRDSDNINRCE